MMTVRRVLTDLLDSCDSLDDPVSVRIIERGELNVVNKVMVGQISRVGTKCHLCIEASDLKQEQGW